VDEPPYAQPGAGVRFDWGIDVEIATQLAVSDVVPVLRSGVFAAAGPGAGSHAGSVVEPVH
jgi:hypothetical protein